MQRENVIEIKNMTFAYEQHPVLENVDLTIAEKDFVSMVGPNGGGKTTLLKIILGILHPARGSVKVFGKPPAEVYTRIGYVPQHAHFDIQFPVSVMDVVLMGLLDNNKIFRPFRREDKEAATLALEEVELLDLSGRPFYALSGGQRQRTLIARALAGNPDLVLMDEPTASLDLHMEAEFYELMSRLNERLTVVMVSHDLGFVSQYVKNVVCVKGKVRMHPTCELDGEILREIYGDMKIVRHDHH